MQFVVLNKDFAVHAQVDDLIDSSIWTERYDVPGGFEFRAAGNSISLSAFPEEFYIWTPDSVDVGIIESAEINSTVEEGAILTTTGRSLASILDRRVVWDLITLNGNLQAQIQRLLNANAIAPTITARRINNLIFEASTDPKITALTVNDQFLGENLLDVITYLCREAQIGFRITLNSENKFVFKLYAGLDRSYDQVMNSRVIFSPDFDNLGDNRYFHSNQSFKSVVRVGGEGEGVDKVLTEANSRYGAMSDLSRREVFRQSNVSSRTDAGDLPLAQYIQLLRRDGALELGNHTPTTAFDGEVTATDSFVYLQHYDMGDIVELENPAIPDGHAKSRVVEFIRSKGSEGHGAYPTLKAL